MKILNALALILVIVGALNWGLVALFEWDLVAEIFGETFGTTNPASRIVYGAVGLAGVYLAATVLPGILRSDERLTFGATARLQYSRCAMSQSVEPGQEPGSTLRLVSGRSSRVGGRHLPSGWTSSAARAA
jgi:uncharacterized membrane protein YuzA (DUF378 family)